MPSSDVIQFFCSSCGKKYRVPSKMAGKKSQCKDCGGAMRVPDAAPVKPAAPAKPKPRKDDRIGLLDDDAAPKKPARPASRKSSRPSSSSSSSRRRDAGVGASAGHAGGAPPEKELKPFRNQGGMPGSFDLDEPVVHAAPVVITDAPSSGPADLFRSAGKYWIPIIAALAVFVVCVVLLFAGADQSYIIFGAVLVGLGMIGLVVSGLWCLVVGFRVNPLLMLLTFVPVVGGLFSLILIISYWGDFKRPFLYYLGSLVLAIGGMFSLGMGGVALPDPPGTETAHNAPRYGANPIYGNNAPSRSTPSPSRNGGTNFQPATPAPEPARPIFAPQQLAAGASAEPAAGETWPVFLPPGVELDQPRPLDLEGYRVSLPADYRLEQVGPVTRGGTEWQVVGPKVQGRDVELTVRLLPLGLRADGQVLEPKWGEVMAAAGVTGSRYDVEFGRIGDIPFARCADRDVASGRAVGRVLYLGKLSPRAPRRLEITYTTHPKAPEQALVCEQIARSLVRMEPVLMPPAGEPDSIPDGLAPPARPRPGETHKVCGPWAFFPDDDLRTRFTKNGSAWEGQVSYSGVTDASISLTLEPEHGDRVGGRPVLLQGPVEVDAGGIDTASAIYAFGGEASHVRLWDDQVFVRIDHGGSPQASRGTQRRITYHGTLGGYRVDIELTSRDGNGLTIAQLEYTLQQARLATAQELIDARTQTDWAKHLLEPGQAAFPLDGGIQAAQALVLDDAGRVALSPQYDPEAGQLFTAYPAVDPEVLAGYEQWDSEEMDVFLGPIERLEGFEIRPVNELGRDHEPRRLSWTTRTEAGRLGMTMHTEPLRPTDGDLLTPILDAGTTDRISFRLGRRTIRPSDPPEVTYRELRNLRVWRVKMAPVARQELARCHYLAIVPGHMLVISVTYRADTPEQLDAFDASVATLVYQDGQTLEPEPSEDTNAP